MTAQPLDRDRLVKLCGMFGSDHPGERANAAAAADKLIRAAGMRWADIIAPALSAPPRRSVNTLADAIRLLRRHDDHLTAWERDFVRSVSAQNRLSAKQVGVIQRLVQKAQRAAGRAA